MSLKTLKDVTEIDGFEVENINHQCSEECLKKPPILIGDQHIDFRLQNGPVGENGVNGCQVDTIIETARLMLIGLNRKFPHDENDASIAYLSFALSALARRKADRERRGVEGTDQV